MQLSEVKEFIQDRVLENTEYYKAIDDNELTKNIDLEILRYKKARYLNLSQREELKKDIYNSLKRLDVLQDLVDNPTITEIMVNGPDEIFIESKRQIEKTNLKALLIEGKQENIEFELMNDYSFFNLDDLEIDKFVNDFLKIYE